jgi:hypothetical protein
MDADTPLAVAPADDEGLTRTMVAQLSPRYAPLVGEELVASTVRAAVADIRAKARLLQFVGLLAQRRAEDQLRQALQERDARRP